jgi:transposase
MSRFATVGHLRSWAGLCPQLDESAGKVRSHRLRYGAPWLKTVLVQCAGAATCSKNNYLHAQFLRLRARHGPKKAILTMAASILASAYYLLRDQVPYRDLRPLYFARLDQDRTSNASRAES